VGGVISLSCGNIPGASYQWYKDATPIAGATARTYTKSGALLTDSGSYTVRISYPPAFFLKSGRTITVTASPVYTVTFDSRGGSGVSNDTAVSGGLLARPADPARDGFDFGGWYTEAALINEWNFTSDTVTSDITLYAKWTSTGGVTSNDITSLEITKGPLKIAPGETFEIILSYGTDNGLPPDPQPTLTAVFADGSELVNIIGYWPNSIRIAARPRDELEGLARHGGSGARASGGSKIYGSVMLTLFASQPLLSSPQQATVAFLVAEPMATEVLLDAAAEDEFARANADLAFSDVMILPGNPQDPIPGGNIVGEFDDVMIDVIAPNPSDLPECFESSGREAASVDIGIFSHAPAGTNGLVPMTYRLTLREAELTEVFGVQSAQAMLSSPLDHLDEIFSEFVIQKEIRQGDRKGWYTRLIDGILKPAEAFDLGIMDVETTGSALIFTLSFYLSDDPALETYVTADGYLIIPDGDGDGQILDPIWLNRWGAGYSPGNYPNSNLSPASGKSGGGCAGGAGILTIGALLVLTAIAGRAKRRRSRH
jgi:uncharacterized repeat protein (TIGR02543 family)